MRIRIQKSPLSLHKGTPTSFLTLLYTAIVKSYINRPFMICDIDSAGLTKTLQNPRQAWITSSNIEDE